VSSSLRYSPQSACLKTTIPVGSRRFASPEERAVTPKPRGVLEYISMCFRVSSVKTHNILVHRVNNDTLVLRAIFAPTPNVGLDNVTTVQEGHFSIGLDPDLCASMRSDDVQSGNVKAEFASLGQLADAVSKTQQVVSGYRGGQVGHVLAHVVDSGFLNTEDESRRFSILSGSRVGQQIRKRLSGVIGELLENRLGFSFCKRTHVCSFGVCRRRDRDVRCDKGWTEGDWS
jgi:hypothetical protein